MRIFHLVNFIIPGDYRRKITENKKIEKYFDLARELKIMLIPIMVVALESVTKELGKGLEVLEKLKSGYI